MRQRYYYTPDHLPDEGEPLSRQGGYSWLMLGPVGCFLILLVMLIMFGGIILQSLNY